MAAAIVSAMQGYTASSLSAALGAQEIFGAELSALSAVTLTTTLQGSGLSLPPPPPWWDPSNLCSNDCLYSGDGMCQDGGSSSQQPAVCELGSDCEDCGPRAITTP